MSDESQGQTTARESLRQLLLRKSVKRGDFTLSSGAKSDLYVDCRMTTFDPSGFKLVGITMHDLYLAMRKAHSPDEMPMAVGGLTMGADPVALSLAVASHNLGTPYLTAFSVRKEIKGHGMANKIEGNFPPKEIHGLAPVVIVDDVITSGGSTIKAIEAARATGARVAFVMTILDREEQDGRAKIEALGVPVGSIFTRTQLLA